MAPAMLFARARARARAGWRLAAAVVGLLAGTACTTLPGPMPDPSWPVPEADCQAWTQQLDAALAAAGVADAEAERLPGVAGLRVDRTTEALRERARAGDAAWAAWLQRAAALDRAARQAEIANLPPAWWRTTPWPAAGAGPAVATPEAAMARTDECRRRAVAAWEAATPAARDTLLARAIVPERYSTARRALGLYPVLRVPFFAGVQRWQDRHRAAMAAWAAAPPPLERQVPEAATRPSPGPLPLDALGLPQPTADEAERLLAWNAPAVAVERRGPHDQFGAPGWRDGRPVVDTGTPVVYQRLAHTRLGGRWRLQLVYTLWFPERPATGRFDILAGALDGVILRLTLDERGEPMLADTIHACGCYHLFFPSAALRPRGDAPEHEEWLFAPAALPELPATHRLELRIASGSHDVMGLVAAPRDAAGQPYRLRPDDELRSRPAGDGRRSLFGPDGLVAGSERGERWLFWPMGIASAGAMRQWGHHATAFVGRRHFDDAKLLERRFEPAVP